MVLPSPGTLIAGKYQLESLLGEGGMGAVFRARHVLMDAPVAVKWLRPDHVGNEEARQRLLREARAIARVRHPNVVQVFDVDTHEGALFMVMELLEGQSLADLIAAENLPIRRVVQLLIGAMQGCAAAHEHGIIHRDIKPENIFVVKDRRHPQGLPKLLDFGISKVEARTQVGPSLTQSGLSVGTPLYMSVEQLTRTTEVDARTDIYSFGVVLYRALTGRPPFDGETFPAVVLSIALATPPPPRQLRSEISGSLEWVVMKAMARKREDRYANMDALIAALRASEALSERPPAPAASLVPSGQSQVRTPAASQVLSASARGAAAAQNVALGPSPAADPISVIRPTEAASAAAQPDGAAPPAKIAVKSGSPAAAAPRVTAPAPATDLAARAQPRAEARNAAGSEPASSFASPAATERAPVADRASAAEPSSAAEGASVFARPSVAERLRAAERSRAAAAERASAQASSSAAPASSNAARGPANAAASGAPVSSAVAQATSSSSDVGSRSDARATQHEEGLTSHPVSPQRTPVPAVSTFASQDTPDDDNPFQRRPWPRQRLAVAAAVVIAGIGIALWGGMSDSLGGARAAPGAAEPPVTHLTQSAPSTPADSRPESPARSSSTLQQRPPPVPFAPPVGFVPGRSSLDRPSAPATPVGGLVEGRSSDATPRAADSRQTPPSSVAPVRRAPGTGFRPVPIISKSGGLRREDF